MGLSANVVVDWDVMKTMFITNCKEHCRGYSMKGDDIFKMLKIEGETLEDYISRFVFKIQRNIQHQLNEESQRHIFLKGVNDEIIESLDLMSGGDITQRSWKDIKRIYIFYSRAIVKNERGIRSVPSKINGSRVEKVDLSNLVSNFKQNIINNVATQLDTMQDKRKHEEVEAMLAEFFPHYREKGRNHKCKTMANLEAHTIPIEFKAIDENNDVLYVS